MSLILVTGSSGLIGSQAARHFHQLGFDIWGLDNDIRAVFFGSESSTKWMRDHLERSLPRASVTMMWT